MSRPQPIQRSHLETAPLKLKQWTGDYDEKRKAAVEWAKLVDEQRIKKASLGDLFHGDQNAANEFDDSLANNLTVPGLAHTIGKGVWDAAAGMWDAIATPTEDLTAQAKHKKKAASPGGIISNGVPETAHEPIGEFHDPEQLEGDRHKPKLKPSLQQTV